MQTTSYTEKWQLNQLQKHSHRWKHCSNLSTGCDVRTRRGQKVDYAKNVPQKRFWVLRNLIYKEKCYNSHEMKECNLILVLHCYCGDNVQYGFLSRHFFQRTRQYNGWKISKCDKFYKKWRISYFISASNCMLKLRIETIEQGVK